MRAAIEAMKLAYLALAEGRAVAPQRQVIPMGFDAVTLLMGGCVPGAGLAAKIVSVVPGNAERGRPVISGLVVALDEITGEPVAILDGTFLTSWRTGAAAGAATDLLARKDARQAALLGCGAQAPAQLLALDTTRELEVVRLFNRTRARAEALAETMAAKVRASLEVADTVGEAVRSADIVTCVTSSTEPLFPGGLLSPGAHLNAMGSFTLGMRELDEVVVGRSRVFIDSLEAALAEAGELVAAERAGATSRADWIEIGRVVAGTAEGRRSPDEITLFKSVGQAAQDVLAASRVVEGAQPAGLGVVVEL